MFGFIRKRPIISFTLLVFFITYAIGLPWLFLTQELEQSLGLREELLSLAWMRAGPTIAGLIVVAIVAGRMGLRTWLSQLLRWRVHPGYYLAIILIVLLPFLASIAVVPLSTPIAASPDLAHGRDWAAIGWLYLQEIAYITVTNGEETGWRFALLGLLLARMRLFPAVLIVGVIWAAWHGPAFFLFDQASVWFPLIGICLGWSVLYGWLYLRTGSLLLPVLAHGAANATFYTFERHFPGLSEAYDAYNPMADWGFAAFGLALALVVLTLDRRLFFGPASYRDGEHWAAGAAR
ncbi:MAG: type II CAAX endopeptidase family protein [Terricaulis sp.]